MIFYQSQLQYVNYRNFYIYLRERTFWLDMAINFKKSCCLRVGPRCDAHCVNLQSMTGSMLQWVDTVRYLGMYLVKAKYFKWSLDYAKHSFHRAANSIFGKIGRISSEESVIQLIKGKCSPILLYGLETCPLKKTRSQIIGFCNRPSLYEII